MMKELILATNNDHKAGEIRAMYADLPVTILSLKDIGWTQEIEENGTTFEENALIKARTIFEATGRAVLADDSGLEIDAFDGGPGVYSSRFMGEDTPYPVKNDSILEQLKDVPEEKRGADFRCVMALVTEAGEFVAEGRIDGIIGYEIAGEGGFGYDPIFYLPERGCTTAQLTSEQKNAISHRGRAAQNMRPYIEQWIGGEGPRSEHKEKESTMITREEIFLPSSDEKTTLHGYIWKPEGKVKAVVQLIHGMEEYIGRYDEFARVLCEHGFGVIGHDHLGHGQSVTGPEELGYFAEEKGYMCVLRDMHSFTLRGKKEFPDKPVYLLGHSMGSFFARRYITIYPRELAGAIFSGTGQNPYMLVHVGKRLAQLTGQFKGDHFRSKFVENMALGSYGTLDQWLCTRKEIVEAYKADPLCGQPFTVGAFKDFFQLLEQLALEKDKDKIAKDFPVLFISGMKDPVGAKSKGVLKAYNRCKVWGMTDVDIFLYKDDMHEVLNETDREDVYRDVIDWLDKHLEARA
ncbi:MAG: RdgB/HAM1 family non-canonical purine NTP pyrophosphatase [Lachnospiraceae bacterium]|nr:RdgB/HAM1 family non-canonical purine NTP pyrophosphatase [Lachnospiraceae bacterium]